MASVMIAPARSSANGANTAIAASDDNGVKILGSDSISFPKIVVNIFVDKLCARTGFLEQNAFKVQENGTKVSIDNLYFSGNASSHKLDFALAFDDTGSMGEEISAMRSKVQGLTDQLKSSGLDVRYALVSFKDRCSIKNNWTNDPIVFKSSVDSLQQKGGDDEPEASLDGIEAILAMGFRPDAQKVVVVITDAHAHYRGDGSTFSNYTKWDIEKDLKEAGVIFIPISPAFKISSSYVDLREISNDIQCTWIDTSSAEFSTILEQIQGILTGTYVIEYTSPDLTPSENRTVLISVEKPGCVKGSASSSYKTPGRAATPQGRLSISGQVYNDSNGNGIKGADESGLKAWDLLLEGPEGYSTAEKTDRNGFYNFTGLASGSYRLEAKARESWKATAPADGGRVVELADTGESGLDLGFKLILISVANQSRFKVVVFPDPNLETEIRKAIHKPEGDIYTTDLIGLRDFYAPEKDIKDLTGMEYCNNLESLYLYGNQITDVLPLAELANLQYLDLSYNRIKDVSRLSGLANMQRLELSVNQITDVSPLSNLKNLRNLYLSANQITDISSLAELKNLQDLYLENNNITDVLPLTELKNLQCLILSDNQIADVSPLERLANLQELYLDNNHITDISPLSGLTNLQMLSLGYNQITDVLLLSGLADLQTLYLNSNQITDISPLSGLTNLQTLSLGYNQITDISSLSELTKLRTLHLYSNQIADISPLAGLTNLSISK
jgi:Leucine-rich repeat (LRR) protein